MNSGVFLWTLLVISDGPNAIIGLDQNPNTDLKTPDLITKYGYPVEAHKVVTEDGYILEMHRIPFGRYEDRRSARLSKNPILLQHGLAGSSADWVLTGPGKALAYMLADEGYDVWLGNNRGNLYSRHHREILSTNRTFWDFSFHELGIYDLPAMIDYILEVTSRYKLLYIGHSQGTTQFWVMTSTRPEYNDKVSLAVGLAPAAYTSHMRGPVTQLAKLTYFGVWVGEKFGYPEFGSRSPWGKFVGNLVCHGGAPTQFLCSNILFLIAGFSQGELDAGNLTVIIGHVPAGASWKQFVHFGQGHINPGHFRAFDYGENGDKNLKLYNSLIPPDYQLEKISTPIALYSSDNDWLATPEDVDLLRAKLPNIVVDYKVEGRVFNHYDFLWGNSAPDILIIITSIMIFQFGIVCLALSLGTDAFSVEVDHPRISKFDLSKNVFEYSEDANLNARELISKYGYTGETHKVTTQDGYILELHRITGPNSNPSPKNKTTILLMHGLLSSSVDWIISGPNKALAYMLTDAGYDVWMGNARGNHYSRSHKRLSVLDKQFWQFSWHEIGIYDLPAMIDYILNNTGSQKIFYAAHSQGTTAFFVMCSIMPEYNQKIIAMSALGPVAYVGHMISPFFQILSRFAPMIENAMNLLGMYEFQPTEKFIKNLKVLICDTEAWSQPICENAMFLVAGFGSDQMNKTLLPAIVGHVPAGSSTKQFIHYSQMVKSKKFRQYDHGLIENYRRYGRFTPPDYQLFKVTAPVVLHYCVNDWLSSVKDVEILAQQLPNVHAKIQVPHAPFSHLDYLWGMNANELLYEKVLGIMSLFSHQ
ncbi:Similar to Lip3: Lipase 3 (Drosophila melanogaster) [Cotesia congregata]|uniref:Similar to Lip3: Lipase 3 (Drosophila melanogaster) n=1 Tax=Cotesia congregata TaxID=51543 RepID=A0A8J2H545_COTCN|nr:Similar to Lip3: Lipase 3 (Drosophila melanogaster) [Cotesia congregata]